MTYCYYVRVVDMSLKKASLSCFMNEKRVYVGYGIFHAN